MTKAWRRLAVVIGLYVLLGLVYDWATPIFEAPDEGYHFAVIRWIGLGNGLPVQRVGEKTDWAQEGSQPPLYHLIAAGLTFWIDTSDWKEVFVWNPLSRIGVPDTTHNVNFYRHTADQAFPYDSTALAVHVVRWLSLGLGALNLLVIYRLALAVFPAQERLALLAAVAGAFNPKYVFVSASVNNDNLLILLSTATLLILMSFVSERRAVERGGAAWKAVGLGLLLGLAALTKVSGLVLWPVAALGVGWGAWRARNWKRFVIGGVITAGVALLVSGWWFWRNYRLYGEWLGLETMVAIAGPREPAITLLDLIRDEWRGFVLSYWSVFGVFTISPATWVHAVFDTLMVWALAGVGWRLLTQRTLPRPEVLLLGLFCLLTLAGVIRWTMQTFASQGRLMFGAIAPLSIFMAAGWLQLVPPRWARGVSLALAGVLALLAALIPVWYIAPRYAPPPLLSQADLPADLRPVHAIFGDGIELIGYTSDNPPRTPGASQPVTLYWLALKAMSTDYALALHLLGREAVEVGKIDTWPGGGNAPTSLWTPGAIYADSYLIPIDARAAVPTLLRLSLDFWEDDPVEKLPITTAAGADLPSVTLRVGRVIAAQAPRFVPTIVEGSTFEHGIELLGLDASADGAVALTLYWRTAQSITMDYTVFIHLTDANGVQVTQADGPPLNDDWPTSAWVPRQPFADTRLMALPPNLAPGRYTLRLGLYDPASGARLLAHRQDGIEWPDDIVVIEDVVEIK